jgi:quercetin dioxygenase-like cupin family protein
MMADSFRGLGLLALATFLFVTTATPQQVKPHSSDKEMSLATPDRLKWVQIRPGNEMAVVYGDPNKAGELYAVRFRFADGFKVPAHWHPQDEHATVLQGTLLLGMGTNWDAAQLTTEMKPGTYIFLPKEMPHFALAKGETVLQAHGIGPFKIIYSNPADDPRNQKPKN